MFVTAVYLEGCGAHVFESFWCLARNFATQFLELEDTFTYRSSSIEQVGLSFLKQPFSMPPQPGWFTGLTERQQSPGYGNIALDDVTV